MLSYVIKKMDEETAEEERKNELRCICTCSSDNISTENIGIPERKHFILTTVSRTENYLRERRIPELIRFLFTKIIAEASDKPVAMLAKLLDDCMLFRAGHGPPPVLYEKKHLEAVIKSFDPGNRGWLSIGQVRRLHATLGLTFEHLDELFEERCPCDMLLEKIQEAQEAELFDLLSTGMSNETFFKKNMISE